MRKSINPKEWRIATLEVEMKNCEKLLTEHLHELEQHEIDYFKEYKDILMNLITEECLLLGEDDE